MKKIIITICLLLLTGCVNQDLGAVNIPEHLKLKTTKDKIIGNKAKGGIVKYAYNSGVKINKENNEILERRTKHSKTFQIDEDTYQTEIIGGEPQYYKDSNNDWWQAEYATTTLEAFKEQTKVSFIQRILGKTAYATTSTFYPDPDAETTSVDGQVRHRTGAAGTGVAWATLQAEAGSDATDANAEDGTVGIEADSTTDKYRIIYRSIRLFDTSAIPDDDTIDSATYSDSTQIKQNSALAGTAFNIYSSAPASNTALVAGDFDSLGTTAFSTAIVYADISATEGVYNNWTLNASGLANISKTGVSKFGVRESGYDAPNVEPTWANSEYSIITLNNAEEIGTAKDPKLVVVHTVGVTFIPQPSIY